MAKKISLSIGNGNKWLKHSDFEVGKAYEFMYAGTHLDNKFGAEVLKFDVIDNEGNSKVLPNCGNLRFQLKSGIDNEILKPDDMLEIVYHGMEYVEKYQREIHKYSVDVIDVEPEGI